jgi:2-C-methyl-D-erythritol 4-phosphate cytidylyltransferase
MLDKARVGVVIPAAGRGVRMGPRGPKQFFDLDGRPVVSWTIEQFQRCAEVDSIVLVVGDDQIEAMRKIVLEYRFSKVLAVVAGGTRRQDSVRNGLRLLEGIRVEIVLVHDAVRPFIDRKMIQDLLGALSHADAAVIAIPVTDTIKLAGEGGLIHSTPPREELWIAQTPQAFRLGDLRSGFERSDADGFTATDEATLVERIGKRVVIVPGSYENIKITTPEDYELAKLIAGRRRASSPTP